MDLFSASHEKKFFKISEALMSIYKLVWDDFCSWYLEMIKPGYEQPIDAKTISSTKKFFEELLKLMQPFTPFVAEELWHLLRERKEGEDIIIASWPKEATYNKEILQQFPNPSDLSRMRKHKVIKQVLQQSNE